MNPRAASLSITLALVLLAVPIPSSAQHPGKVYRIGLFWASTRPSPANTSPQQCPIRGWPSWQAFLEGLREYGYLLGQNLVIECRWLQGQTERAPAIAAELVSLTPDLILAGYSHNILALKQATRTIPILMLGASDPVGMGFVASLAHPGGNVTGLTDTAGWEVVGKQLQLLKEAVPKASRVADLYSPAAGPPIPAWRTEVEAAARALGLTVQTYRVQAPEELEGAFAAMTKARAEVILVEPSGFFDAHQERLVDFAAKSQLPAMYSGRSFVNAGGLMSYWANAPAIWRRAGFYVDKLFHGANPADLPVERPTQFDLIINLKAAKAIGLTIPQSLLSRADEVIE